MFSKNGKFMLVIIGAIAVGAFVFGSAPAALLQVGLLALCPLMMLFMHGGHGGHSDHSGPSMRVDPVAWSSCRSTGPP